MEPFMRKRLLIVAVAYIVYMAYIISRLRSKTDHLRTDRRSEFPYYGGPFDLIISCKEMGTFLITYSSSKNYEGNAMYLYRTNFGYSNICDSNHIDICDEDVASSCKTIDIKLFVLFYFREILANDLMFNKRTADKCIIHDILPDRNDGKLKEELKVFGMMIGLSIAHRIYLGIKFEEHFLCDSSLSLLYTLEYLDPEQYKIYKDAQNASPYNYQIDNTAPLKIVPNSTKPFRDAKDPDPLAIEYPYYKFPFEKAADQIFIDPYKISRDLIFEGMKKVLSRVHYTTNREYLTSYYDHGSEYYSLKLKDIILTKSYNSINIYNWKDNSECAYSGRIFFKVLRRLEPNQIKAVYEKATGFTDIPLGGFSRLPKTKIITGNGKMFPEPFLIIIKPKISENDLLEIIIILEHIK